MKRCDLVMEECYSVIGGDIYVIAPRILIDMFATGDITNKWFEFIDFVQLFGRHE